MNLGDSTVKYVNTSRPQLVHTNSKQSITASDDYYSLASETSSGDDRATAQRYETPPMHMRSAGASRDALQSEATIAPLRPVKHKAPTDRTPAIVTAGEPSVKRKLVRRSTASSDGTIVRRPVEEVHPPTPGVDNTPYIHFAIDQLTRDEEVTGQRNQRAESEASYPVERIVPDQGLGYHESRSQRQPPDPNERRTGSPRKMESYISLNPVANRFIVINDVLVPTEPTNEVNRYPKLNFIPPALRLLSVGALLLGCLLMIAGSLFCAIWPNTHTGLWRYDGVGTGRYFIFQYLPTLLASIIIIWLLIIQNAAYRIVPFVALSSRRSTHNSGVLHDMKLFPTNYLIPNFKLFKHQEPLLGVCSLVSWLALFTVPLQSCLFQTRYYTEDGLNTWRWTAVQPVAWTLFVLYLLLSMALLLLFLRFAFRPTGLKWDPVCLADILVLIHRSNFLSDFNGSEVGGAALKSQPWKNLRLGYWMTWRRATEIFYGIGEENAPVRRYSLESGEMMPVTEPSGYDLEGQQPMKASSLDPLQREIHIPTVRYAWVPWFLRDGFVVAWIAIAIVLMIAFVVVGFVDRAVEKGFLPLLPAPTTPEGFSPADFLYSFLPSFLGMVLFLLWQPIDMSFRALQPFSNLANGTGTSADQSLLLDYPACLPIEVTFKATTAGHYKVAWISFVSLLSITLPILGGGIFTAQFKVEYQDIFMAASMPGYYSLVVFVIIYALSFLFIWPGQKRHLPHDISTLGQLISFVYQSPLLADIAFREPRSKIDLVTKLFSAPTGDNRYTFGVYSGLDGKEHLGIDRLERREGKEMRTTADSTK